MNGSLGVRFGCVAPSLSAQATGVDPMFDFRFDEALDVFREMLNGVFGGPEELFRCGVWSMDALTSRLLVAKPGPTDFLGCLAPAP